LIGPFRIQQLGGRVVIDDFGTGYASLSYLKKSPLDGLKIDRSFVLELRADSDDAAMVGLTIGLSNQLGLSVTAKGIENHATADLLVSMDAKRDRAILRPADAGRGARKPIPDGARRRRRGARAGKAA
jgi:predicted signal transduction protein with EAL and GGDEF domain